MRFVDIVDGAFEVRWTWLPFWLATNPSIKQGLEKDIAAVVALNAITDSEEDLDALNSLTLKAIASMFPGFPGLYEFLIGLKNVSMK